jgi:DNA-binding response OmpR family regulator
VAGQEDIVLGPLRLVRGSRRLMRDKAPVTVSGRAFDILGALAEVAGETAARIRSCTRYGRQFLTESRPPYIRPDDYGHLLGSLRRAGWRN